MYVPGFFTAPIILILFELNAFSETSTLVPINDKSTIFLIMSFADSSDSPASCMLPMSGKRILPSRPIWRSNIRFLDPVKIICIWSLIDRI
mgnify:CR=1 FL=1